MSDQTAPSPLLFALPAVLVAGGFAGGLLWSIGSTPLPTAQPTPEPFTVIDTGPAYSYLPFRNTLTVAMPRLGGNVYFELAMLIDSRKSGTAEATLEANQSAVVSLLSEAVEARADTLTSLEQIRRDIQPVFRDVLNDYLTEDGDEGPIEDVLLTTLRVSQ